ncbi:putative pectinesterase 11 [Capsicum baccatum]|uniref:pectinesterase n=1 Tax=Capsicum baccatum TaxID=33114 RepID=A0A2G2XPA2_CAPBA|nr:putative pectinesterase 11 [Capsicum baccatum]
MRKKRTEKRKARTLPVDDDEVEDAFAAFIFFNALIRSIHARLIIASSMISLISFWSAASKDNPLGGRLHSLSQSNGATTTQHRQLPQENTGFTFVGCKITGVKSAILRKPWGTYARVVFVQTYTSSVILPNGWEDIRLD